MKKVLLLSLSLVLGFSAFAQQRIMKNDSKQAVASAKKAVVGKDDAPAQAATFAPQSVSVVNRYEEGDETQTVFTFYDLQSNQYVANRMYQLPNGSVAITATMSHEDNQTASDRGTGYNFYNGSEWATDELEDMTRIEPFKTGWPSIARYGANGEILFCHGNGHMQYFIRETAGQGEWTYVGYLPDTPEGYPYSEYPTWPRVVTCGPNHDIVVVVAALQHSISSDETDIRTYFARTENAMDPNSWTCSYGPLANTGLGYEVGTFSADDYALAANGNDVALLYSGCLTNSVWMFKSTDCGLNWETTRVWENPYEGREFDEEPSWGMEDTLFMPMNGTIAIDNNGVAHVALNTFEMIHTLENEPGYYSYYYGRAVDGILYWNDTQEPIHDTDHPEYIGTVFEEHFATANPHHAARLWWPIADDPGYVHMSDDSTKWAGFIPMWEGISWENDMFYHASTEYVSKFYGASGHPALSCDPNGNLVLAYSSPDLRDTRRFIGESGTYYYRSIFTSVRVAEEGYWHTVEDCLTDPDVNVMHMQTEGTFTVAVPNTTRVGEFWFGYQDDNMVGFYWGSNASQTEASENYITAVKVNPEIIPVGVKETEAVNPMTTTRVYPTPTTNILNVEVNASQNSDVNISVFNIMGQKVSEQNTTVNTGINTTTINTESLSSGIYFVTVKANGFENTMKFVVE